MLLCIDMGNTNITLGCYKNDELLLVSRMYTAKQKSSDEYAIELLDIFNLYNVDPKDFTGCIFASVVPQLIDPISRAVKRTTGIEPLLVGEKYNGNLKVKILPVSYLGADLIAGSLIKNLGGGFAPTGGYIVGRADLVEKASYRLTCPGLGGEMGATLGDTAREFYQGLFMAPHIVLQAVKTAIFAASVFKQLGYDVKPLPEEKRSDIIQAITLESRERLCNFCVAIQSNSPVDAHVEPVPSPLPGYQDEIIMAAGTFVQGASIELSADGPCREPFNVYFQGGLTFEHGRLAIMAAAEKVGAK